MGILPNLCRDEASGEGVGATMAKALDGKDYQLVITGHSLGAGTAALIGLKLKDRFPGGSLVAMQCTSQLSSMPLGQSCH